MPEPKVAQAVAHLEAFRRLHEDDALIDRATGLTAEHLDTLLAYLGRTKEAATTKKRHLKDLIRENEADAYPTLAGASQDRTDDQMKEIAHSRDLRDRQTNPFPPSDWGPPVKKTNNDGQTFGSWLFARQRSSVSIGHLIGQAKADKRFPRYGTPDDVRDHLNTTNATRFLLQAVDEAETLWMGAVSTTSDQD